MRDLLLSIWFALFAITAVTASYWLFRLIVVSSRTGANSNESQRLVRRRFASFGMQRLLSV